jgi:hypothetical protein
VANGELLLPLISPTEKTNTNITVQNAQKHISIIPKHIGINKPLGTSSKNKAADLIIAIAKRILEK